MGKKRAAAYPTAAFFHTNLLWSGSYICQLSHLFLSKRRFINSQIIHFPFEWSIPPVYTQGKKAPGLAHPNVFCQKSEAKNSSFSPLKNKTIVHY